MHYFLVLTYSTNSIGNLLADQLMWERGSKSSSNPKRSIGFRYPNFLPSPIMQMKDSSLLKDML